MTAPALALPLSVLASDTMPWWPKPDPETFGEVTPLQILALVVCFVIPLIGWALLFRQVARFVKHYRLGRPEPRTDRPGARTWVLIKEFLGHTRMSRLPAVAVAHWFTSLSFLILFATLVNAFFQLVRPDYRLPIIGHFPPFEWLIELFAWTGLIGIVVLMVVRQKAHPRGAEGEQGRRSRFFGSTFWQAYYVELTILGVTICILLLRTLEAAMVQRLEPESSLALHFPLTGWLAGMWSGLSLPALAQVVYLVAMIKILISFAWMITISLQPTMGVAWHRFLAFPNIWFKREADGSTALGAAKPMTIDGKPFSMEAMEEMDEETTLGVGKVEDFTWKGLLDFTTCTECGRCQSQCPAWNTDKPLSPKLLMMTLRDHAAAKAPYLQAVKGGAAADSLGAVALADPAGTPTDGLHGIEARKASSTEIRTGEGQGATAVEATTTAVPWAELPLIGETGYDLDNPLTAYNPHGPDAVIDQDVLWSCTTCGACVEQCPVDIEHVDHILDMRRYQNLIESAFPSELGGLFKNLENKGNPWGMGARARMDWAKDLPFEVKVAGKDVENLSDVDYLFWVGCAGAYEDRAKKTSRAVAELLDTAGVSFAVLGDGETCTGDSARRAGNEVLFQMLGQQNVETMNELGATKIVVTCAHCFNTIKNEYPQLGGQYEVVHHTQLLNRLVREKRLTPVAAPQGPKKSSAKDVSSNAPTVTYHDPCYLGRHNDVYAPPRELIGSLPGVELREMPRSGMTSFCCGAGGARMWMEEKLGTRINVNRTEEAIATGAERIAVGCPFCRVMLSDGLTAKQSEGASEDIEVVDVAQMLLAAVRRSEEAVEEEGTTEADDAESTNLPTAVDQPAEVAQTGDEPVAEEPSAAESEATGEAIREAEAGDATIGTSAEPKATGTPAGKTMSWEDEVTQTSPAPAPAAAPKAEGAPTGAAPKGKTMSWEDEATPAAPAAAATESTTEEPKTEAAPAAAAPKGKTMSWEDEATPAAPAAAEPKAEEPEAPQAEEPKTEAAPATAAVEAEASQADAPKAAATGTAPAGKLMSWEPADTPVAEATPAPAAEKPAAEEPAAEEPAAEAQGTPTVEETPTPELEAPAEQAEASADVEQPAEAAPAAEAAEPEAPKPSTGVAPDGPKMSWE